MLTSAVGGGYTLAARPHSRSRRVYLFNAIPGRHEALISASRRREDRAGIPGPIDMRIEPCGQHWLPVGDALVAVRDSLASTGRPPDLHVVVCKYQQHNAATECRVTIGVSRIVHVRQVEFRTVLRMRLGAPVTLAGVAAGGTDLPTFSAHDAPLVARQLNQALNLRRTLAGLMRASYRLGSEVVTIEPQFRLAPLLEKDISSRARTTSGALLATEVDVELCVTTTLAPGLTRHTLGAREFGVARKQLLDATSDSPLA